MPTFNGTPGNDTIHGSAGNDTINGGDGNDWLFGHEGDDFLNGGSGDNRLIGGEGDDTLWGGEGSDVLVGGAGDDQIVDDINGISPGDDLLVGGDGNDFLSSGAGNDTLIGGDGNDFLTITTGELLVIGGSGTDTLHYGDTFSHTTLVVDLEAGTLSGTDLFGQPVSASLHGIENYFHGALGAVHVTGSSRNNDLMGHEGNDTLNGGLGNDNLSSEGGSDRFFFDAVGEANADRIADFSRYEPVGIDKIVLDSSVMTGLGAAGQLADDDERWYSAAGATGGAEEDDRIVYDSEAGKLYYDADGSGAGAAQLIANVFVWLDENTQRGGALVGSDIIIA
jgi:serralysin